MNELDINNPQLPDFIVPGADEKKQDEPAKIKVIGVGGGGGNAVNHMYRCTSVAKFACSCKSSVGC